jgi:hypothetical protein
MWRCVSKWTSQEYKNLFFGPTDQKLWVYEVFRRSLGRAGMCWSQLARVDHMCQKVRVGEFLFLFLFFHTVSLGHLAVALFVWHSNSFGILLFIIILFITFLWKCGDGPGILEKWVHNTPIFWSLPLHLEVLNLPLLMELGDFIIFQILFLLKLEDTWTFISTIGILVSWKSEFTKNSTRIASIMEILCTPLQCRVDLSMFHSSSNSKIWHTST